MLGLSGNIQDLCKSLLAYTVHKKKKKSPRVRRASYGFGSGDDRPGRLEHVALTHEHLSDQAGTDYGREGHQEHR